jgi:hypothetical protein
MRERSQPVAVPAPCVQLPDPEPNTELEVIRLRRMVHAMAEMLVECGVIDASMVEGRLRLAAIPFLPPARKKLSWWTRLFRTRSKDLGAVPTVMMPIDQTVPVQRMPFEVQSLYDEGNLPSVVVATPRAK